MSFGELVEIQKDLFGAVHAAFAPAPIGILFAFFSAGVIKVLADPRWYAEIGLLDSTEHLFIKVLLQALRWRHHLVGVGILGLEIFDDLGIGFLAEPEVIVVERASVDRRFVRYFLCDRRLHGHAADLRQGCRYGQRRHERRRDQTRA